MAGLYLHIPFCKQKCSYCDFHFSTLLRYIDPVIEAMNSEIALHHHLIAPTLSSLYIGGGSPSILNNKQLESIFEQLHQYFNIDPAIEITLEANPDDLSKEKISHWKSLGINRISLGVQSFFEDDLQLMRRMHTAKQIIPGIELLKEAGFQRINIDLIYGIPTSSHWEANLDLFLSLAINHLSAYALTLEPNTILQRWLKQKKYQNPTDEKQEKEYKLLINKMLNNDFEAYEISNFAKNKEYAQHNISYWQSIPYLGIGPSAHSFFGHKRQWNIANNQLYIKKIKNKEIFYESEELNFIDQYNEYILLRLRTQWGLEKDFIKLFPNTLQTYFSKIVSSLVTNQNLIETKEAWIIPQDKRFLSDGIISQLFYVKTT